MPIELPGDVGGFHALLKQRIRDQDAIDEYHKHSTARAAIRDAKKTIGLPQVRVCVWLSLESHATHAHRKMS